MVAANDIPPDELNKAPHLPRPLHGPLVIAAQLPADKQERSRILTSAIATGVDLPHMPQYYLPYEQVSESVKARIQTLDNLINQQPEQERTKVKSQIEASLARHKLLAKDVGYLPLQARAQDMTVLVKRDDATFITILPITPW